MQVGDDGKTSAQRRYEAWSTFPIFVASLIWLIAAFFEFDPRLSSLYQAEGRWLGGIVWALFAIDLLIRFMLDREHGTFVKRNWLLFIALLVPPLRIIFVIGAVHRITRDRNTLTKQVGLYALYSVATVVFLGALLTLTFEIDAPGASITSFGDAVWWAFVTVTTVGYGDFTPVTERGRTIAVLIMFTGAAAVGALTAALASRFSASKAETVQVDNDVVALRDEVVALRAQLAAVAAHLGVAAAPLATPATSGSPQGPDSGGGAPTRPGGE